MMPFIRQHIEKTGLERTLVFSKDSTEYAISGLKTSVTQSLNAEAVIKLMSFVISPFSRYQLLLFLCDLVVSYLLYSLY